jgi:transketolase
MRNSFIETLIEIRNNDSRISLFTADLGYNVLNDFAAKFPDSYFNVGVAEQSLVLVASGFALNNKISFVYSIVNFNTMRVLEHIRNGPCYHNLNLKIVSLGAGFAYGQLGFTHHATEDIAVMSALPNMKVFSPADAFETKAVTKLAIDHDGPAYIRLGKGGEPNIHSSDIHLELGRPVQLWNGKKIAILSTGSITFEALNVCKYYQNIGIPISLYSFQTIKPIDIESIYSILFDYEYVITLEEHNKYGGFGSIINSIIVDFQRETKKLVVSKNITLNDQFSKIVGTQKFLKTHHHLDEPSIINVLNQFINLN